MLSFEEAGAVLDAACEALPDGLFDALNGGVSPFSCDAGTEQQDRQEKQAGQTHATLIREEMAHSIL